ncbi:MAG TPA: tetratricopeptide repeat protein [Kofleriaceae bacterium]|nr:tetratricopeptide repeat protein [Kofleriaceae bacterium]
MALLAIAGLATSTAASAHADAPVPPRARELTARGRELHEQGDYAGAIAAFKEAYVLAPRPGLLFNIAQAYRLLGDCDDAEHMYRRYLATDPSPEQRALAEAHLAAVVLCVPWRDLDLRVDASIARLDVPPPAGLGLRAEPPVARPSGRGRLVQRLGLGASIGGAAALSAAAYYGVRAYVAQRDVERRYAHGTTWPDLAPLDERGKRAAVAARWLGIGGGAATAAGVALFLIGRSSERAVAVAAFPARRGAQIGVAWTF